MKKVINLFNETKKVRLLIGWIGLLITAPFILWGMAGLLGIVPSMLKVFGLPGLRIPAGITIFGLLIAAIGFWDYD
ncbi:hypothetical protein ACCI51_02530 [Microbulbifer echini]|uniref:CPBP family intramembrane metalloprotease n=1 Tax=Microbulbifer echini TaxID=1529067 RepID=A0ABV4NJJ8_9GAMM|nr:hypothetical protein [uncultured Microbulbifer sp.]